MIHKRYVPSSSKKIPKIGTVLNDKQDIISYWHTYDVYMSFLFIS